MPISLRAAALRTALERALDEPVHLLVTNSGVRVYVSAPAVTDRAAWLRVIQVLGSADAWGSTDAHGAPEVWAEVGNE
ncbi:hypothetical protein [Streptomyces sp. NPDC056165]|uniref:hypothetical protein n=1 Tax=Streptomyces sp. NPDC056165 TaxID=3345733 RepID=UPI0035DF7AF8